MPGSPPAASAPGPFAIRESRTWLTAQDLSALRNDAPVSLIQGKGIRSCFSLRQSLHYIMKDQDISIYITDFATPMIPDRGKIVDFATTISQGQFDGCED
jgi:hypothetical protein